MTNKEKLEQVERIIANDEVLDVLLSDQVIDNIQVSMLDLLSFEYTYRKFFYDKYKDHPDKEKFKKAKEEFERIKDEIKNTIWLIDTKWESNPEVFIKMCDEKRDKKLPKRFNPVWSEKALYEEYAKEFEKNDIIKAIRKRENRKIRKKIEDKEKGNEIKKAKSKKDDSKAEEELDKKVEEESILWEKAIEEEILLEEDIDNAVLFDVEGVLDRMESLRDQREGTANLTIQEENEDDWDAEMFESVEKQKIEDNREAEMVESEEEYEIEDDSLRGNKKRRKKYEDSLTEWQRAMCKPL